MRWELSMSIFEKLRKIHWGLILLCLFLPLVRSCGEQCGEMCTGYPEIIYPFKEIFKSWENFTRYCLPAFYPLMLAILWSIMERINSENIKFKIGRAGYVFLSAVATYFIFRIVQDAVQYPSPMLWDPFYFDSIPVLLWGIMFLGLVRIKDFDGLKKMVGFLSTSLALWFFPVIILFAEKLLIGAWLYIIASVNVVLLYIVEYFYNIFHSVGKYKTLS